MNQDQVKEALLVLHPVDAEFTVIFSGKKSKIANGIYKPATREIILHNQNFQSDNDLFYTALHEYAHHIDCTTNTGKARGHSIRFRSIFHSLLSKAEAERAYKNPTKGEAFTETTKAITGLISESGRILRETGELLIKARTLCEKNGARFDDYVMRQLKQTMPWALAAMKAAAYQLDSDLGAENMKAVAAIKNDEERTIAASAIIGGEESIQQIKAARASGKEPEDPLARLENELGRIEKTISKLVGRAAETEKRIEELRSESVDDQGYTLEGEGP